MRNFNYRNPRFDCGAELAFQTGEGTVQGVCTNVSQEGLLATFERGVQEPGTCGSLVLRYPGRQFTLAAVVTHREEKEVGLSFLSRTEEERTASEQFAVFLQRQTKSSVLPQSS